MAILLALGLGLFGALCLGMGLFCFFRDRRLLSHFSEVGEGVVSGFTEPDDEGFVRPRVRFARSGVIVTITGSCGSNPPAYQLGQKVPVRYPLGKPGKAIIADFNHLYLFEVSSIVFGAASVGVAILLVVLYFYVQP
ncbi:DUF3592 domain-containing protein [Anatilimnocola sp. NA78]|uniref:DUF3592 domain-containing protein n=1 Tax=Anatilimnocola sp. NA78 TaxID=3415683 RepID=UPI003CE505F6